jgi:predicted phosphodiesterase
MEKNKPPIVEKPPQAQLSSLFEQLTSLQQLVETSRQKEIWKDSIEIRVRTRGLPFMLMPLSDLHIGAEGVDYQELKKHLDFIKENPVYTVLVGDLVDNFSPLKHPTAMKEDVMSPTDQWAIARSFFKEYEDKIIGVVSGNHDEWTGAVGIDIYRWLTEDLNIPLLKGGGSLRLNIDDQEFKIRLWHRIARLNSQFNYTHAGKQALRLAGDDSDVIITGDKHLGGIEQTYIGNKKRTIVQLGTFKVEDSFGRSQGFVQHPRPLYPVLMFFPNAHNIEIIESIDQAEELISAVKRFYHQKAVSLIGLNKTN